MKFRKKPVVIEARQLTPSSINEIAYWSNAKIMNRAMAQRDQYLVIPTLEGDMSAMMNDWIIQGIKGEFYPCKPDIFEATYERVD
mgnify:CR=1 FL=1